MTDAIEFDPVDAIGAGAFGQPGAAHLRHPGAQGRRGALGARREGAGRAARGRGRAVPRPHRRGVPGRARHVRRARQRRRGRGSRAAVPGPAHRDRLRPRAISWCCSSCASRPPKTTRAAAARSKRAKVTSRGSTRRARRSGRWRRERRRRRVGRPPDVPAVRLSDGSRRAHLPADELNATHVSEAEASGWPEVGPIGEDAARAVLRDGEVEVLGRMPWSSNATFLVMPLARRRSSCSRSTSRSGASARSGTFPRGTLCHREVAACEVSEALGWDDRARHRAARRAGRASG